MRPDLKPILQQMIDGIARRSTFYGSTMPPAVMSLFEIEEDDSHVGVLAPFWIGVFQRGRGPRKNNVSHGLENKIYAWMEKRNLFKSTTQAGKQNEARYLTWYINKYGNKHFRSGRFIDIYETERQVAIDKITARFSIEIGEITRQVI